jgi:hypothetical protein
VKFPRALALLHQWRGWPPFAGQNCGFLSPAIAPSVEAAIGGPKTALIGLAASLPPLLIGWQFATMFEHSSRSACCWEWTAQASPQRCRSPAAGIRRSFKASPWRAPAATRPLWSPHYSLRGWHKHSDGAASSGPPHARDANHEAPERVPFYATPISPNVRAFSAGRVYDFHSFIHQGSSPAASRTAMTRSGCPRSLQPARPSWRATSRLA